MHPYKKLSTVAQQLTHMPTLLFLQIIMNTEKINVGVVGSGAFGTCLAMQCARRGHNVLLWTRQDSLVQAINETHTNPVYFKASFILSLQKDSAIGSSLPSLDLEYYPYPA